MRPKRGKVHLDFKTTSVYACWADQCRKTVDHLLMEPDSDGVRVESSTENFKWQEQRSRDGFLSHAEHRKVPGGTAADGEMATVEEARVAPG